MATITPPKVKAGGKDAAGKDAAGKDADAAPRKRGKLKLLAIALAIVLAVAAGGAGTYFLFLAEPAEPEPPGPGEMVPMAPQTLSLVGGHYVKVGVSLELVDGAAIAAEFDTSKAAELVIDTFSNREIESLRSNETRKRLSTELLEGVRTAYPDQIYSLYLTEFVLQ